MTKPIQYAALCSLSVLLAACGADRSGESQPITTASRTSASVAAQAQPASAYYNVVQHIYVGYFGRPADAGGLAFFAQHLSNLGAPTNIIDLNTAYGSNAELRAVIDGFGNSAESQALYAGDNNVFIEAVYRNLFGRAAEPAGKAHWVNAINTGGMTRANAAMWIMVGAQGTDRDVINKKTAVAASFTTSLNSPLRTFAYGGLDANVVVRNLLGTVNLSSDTAAFQPNIDAALNTLVTRIGAQGMYAGKMTASGMRLQSLVLENGDYWSFYGGDVSGPFAPTGFVQGNGSSADGVFSSANAKDFGGGTGVPVTVGANYVPLASFNGTITVSTGPLAFTGTSIADTTYRYAAPANLAEIAGSQRIDGSLGYHIMQVATDGSFSGTSGVCNYSGKLTPRASGRNVFDATWSFGSACALANQSTTGIAFAYPATEDAPRTLIIATTNASRTSGALATTDGLLIRDTVEGAGAVAAAGKTMTVHYTGWLYDATKADRHGAQFDSSATRGPYSFTIGQVIKGWDRGVVGMKVGGKRTLIIPPALAYGARGTGSIPPNATLVFDVELVGVR